MSFWCNENCRLQNGQIRPGICRCCPTAEYYRSQYQIDRQGRAFEKSIAIPLPINSINFDPTAFGNYFSTFQTAVAVNSAIPFNAQTTANLINTSFDGKFILTMPGTYLITYTLFTSSGGCVKVLLDDFEVDGSKVFSSAGGVLSGNIVLNLNSSPFTIKLINCGNGEINLIGALPNGASAQLTITKI